MINIPEAMVVKVYSGKPKRCMCGCSGTYYYPSRNKEEGEAHNGNISDGMVRKVLKLFAETIEMIEFQGGMNKEDKIFTVILHDRQYTIYAI